MDWCPERYQLPPALAEVLGLQYGHRQQVMSAIWNYARTKLLQSRQEPDLLELDGRMEKVCVCGRGGRGRTVCGWLVDAVCAAGDVCLSAVEHCGYFYCVHLEHVAVPARGLV
jgi:hypothetical protein